MAAGVERLLFALSTGTGIIGIAVADTGCRLLTLQHPSVAAAGGASPAVLRTAAVVFIDISPKILGIGAP